MKKDDFCDRIWADYILGGQNNPNAVLFTC